MQWGRRKAHFFACIVGILGVAFTMLKDFKMQLLGRLVYGIAAGLQSVVTPRFIEEYVPLELCGTCIAIFVFAQNFGLLVAMLIACILPDDFDTEGLAQNNSWRFIFGLPILTYSMIALWLKFMIPYDSPKYHILRGQRHLALKSIHMVYQTEGNQRTAQKIYNYIKMTSADGTSRTSFS